MARTDDLQPADGRQIDFLTIDATDPPAGSMCNSIMPHHLSGRLA
jgi:hypothetical protein